MYVRACLTSMHKILHCYQQQGFCSLQDTGSRNTTEPATQLHILYIHIHTYLPVHYRTIFTKESSLYERISGWNRTELAASHWTKWRGALCHILHTRRWHRTINWHWEWPDPLQLDRTWEEQSVHQHCSAGCQHFWEVEQKCSNSTTRWVITQDHCTKDMQALYIPVQYSISI